MTLGETIEAYIAWRRSLGTEFRTESQVLRFFLKHVDGERGCDDVTCGQVCTFLAGNGRLTQTRSHRYCILTGFFRYAIARGHATRSPLPLPEDEPKKPSPLPPYIYTHDELRRLFAALGVRRRYSRQLDTTTVRTLLLLLYGAGLRGAEARGLTLAHVDLRDAVLTVRDTKFHKSRLVPVGPQLTAALRQYRNLRATRPYPDGEDSPFLAKRDGTRLASSTVNHAFRRLLRLAGIHDTDRTRQSPNMARAQAQLRCASSDLVVPPRG